MAVSAKTVISFGLVAIPIAMYTATQDNDISFNQLHKDDGSRIKYKKVCAHCGKEVSAADIVKGYQYDEDHYVIVTDDELEKIKTEKEKSIQILHFAQLDQISPIFYDKCYHVVPEAGGDKAFELLRRALMSDPFKIKLAATKFPVNFTAFDILSYAGKDMMSRPLEERQERLKKAVTESERLAVTRVIEGQGKALYSLTEQQGLEGVVAKRRGSLYYPGKRTKDWIKCKNLQDDDFVVCGYIRKGQGVTSIVLGQYRDNELVYKGHVTLGVAGGSFRRIVSLPSLLEPPYQVPAGNEKAVWVVPQLVCTIKFMERTANGGMRQPVFKGLRDDKAPQECIEV